MKSEVDVRREANKLVLVTNLVVHHGVANIFNQANKFVRILDVAEESLDVPLFRQWGQITKNASQFPSSPHSQALLPILERTGLPFQDVPP